MCSGGLRICRLQMAAHKYVSFVSDQAAFRCLDDANASWSRFRAFYGRLGRGLEACHAVWEASWGMFHISLTLLGASCWFFSVLKESWRRLGGGLEAS